MEPCFPTGPVPFIRLWGGVNTCARRPPGPHSLPNRPEPGETSLKVVLHSVREAVEFDNSSKLNVDAI